MAIALTEIIDEPIKNSREKIDSNFQTIEAVLNNYVQNVFDVTAYGAVFDGTTDDTAAIQSAIDAAHADGGGIVLLPKGTAKISTALIVYSNIAIIGQGREVTILQTTLTTGSLAGGAIISSNNTDVDNLYFENFKVLGHGETQTAGSGFYLTAASGARNNIIFNNIYTQDFPEYGVYINTPILVSFNNCRFRNAGIDNVFVELGTSTSFKNCYASGGNRSNFHLKTMTYCSFDSCASEYGTYQYWIEGGGNIVFNGCGSEVAMRADAGALGIVSHYRVQSAVNVVFNGCYTAQFAYLNSIPAYHWYITASTRILLNGARGTANLLAPSGEQHEAPTNTVLIDASSEVTLNNTYFSGEVGAGVSGTPKVEIDSTGFLKLQGYLSTKGILNAIATKTSNYTLGANDYFINANASGGALTITLPPAASHSGRVYVVKKTDSSTNAVTIDGDASETIDGRTTYKLTRQYDALIFQSNGSAWYIANKNPRKYGIIVDADGTGDYTDIQSALDAVPSGGGLVTVKAGTYTITSTLLVKTNRTTLVCEDGVVIQGDGASVTPFIKPNTTSLSQIFVRGGKWLQTNATAQGVCFDFSDCPNHYVSNCRIEEFGTAINLVDTTSSTFYSSYRDIQAFNCNNGVSIAGTQANNNIFDNVRIKPKVGGGGKGIFLSDARGITFVGCNVEVSAGGGTGITGIHIDATSRENVFVNCWVEANETNVLIESGATRTTFIGCSITSPLTTNISDSGTDTVYLNTSSTGTTLKTFLEVANLDTDTALSANSDTKIPSQKAVKAYADGLVVGLIDYRGAYDASGNVFPSSGGSGASGAIKKGDLWVISVAGTLGGSNIQVGDSIIANADTPGQTSANWDKLNTNISYVPEDSANKDTDGTLASNSDTKYASQKAVKTYVDTGLSAKQNRLRSLVSKVHSDSPYSVATTDDIVSADATSGAIVLNLPASSGLSGRIIYFKRLDATANSISIVPNGAETIDGDASLLLVSQYDAFCLYSNGSNWFVI